MKKQQNFYMGVTFAMCSFISMMMLVFGTSSIEAFEPGKTYDKSNYQEIEDLLAPAVLNWIKRGEIILHTGEQPVDLVPGEHLIEDTKKNEGKYDITAEGLLIEKATGEMVTSAKGWPFPNIDLNDPRAGTLMAQNHSHNRALSGVTQSSGFTQWVGENGYERDVASNQDYFFYVNSLGERVPNPNKFEQQLMTFVTEPFDLRGVISMSWIYLDERQSTNFSYLPMLRRVRRASGAARSDPFMGSDTSTDDSQGYSGKVADMTWEYLGTKDFLVPYVRLGMVVERKNPDGSFVRTMTGKEIRPGYAVPGWQGAPWHSPDVTFVKRPIYLLEFHAKDEYYNYGKMILYEDAVNYISYYKEIYDKAGEYWKCLVQAHLYHEIPGKAKIITVELTYVADDRTRHATVSNLVSRKTRPGAFLTPVDVVGPHVFTASNMIQMSK